MSLLESISKASTDTLSSVESIYRGDSPLLACSGCKQFHRPREENLAQDIRDWFGKHVAGQMNAKGILHRPVYAKPDDIERFARRVERRRKRLSLAKHYAPNVNVNIAYQATDQFLVITHLNGLADSPTLGYGSNAVDNTANLYLDYHAAVTLAAVNTPPANYNAFYIFFAGALNTTDLPTTGATSGGTVTSSTSADSALTFPDITSTQQQNLIPQTGAPINGQPIQYKGTNTLIQTPAFPIALYFGGNMPRFFWYTLVNHAGMTIAGSGNAWKYRGLFLTD